MGNQENSVLTQLQSSPTTALHSWPRTLVPEKKERNTCSVPTFLTELFVSQDEVLFDSWNSIFNHGTMKENVPIYSFDGKNVLTDSTWWYFITTPEHTFIYKIKVCTNSICVFFFSFQAWEDDLARVDQCGSPTHGRLLWDVEGWWPRREWHGLITS